MLGSSVVASQSHVASGDAYSPPRLSSSPPHRAKDGQAFTFSWSTPPSCATEFDYLVLLVDGVEVDWIPAAAANFTSLPLRRASFERVWARASLPSRLHLRRAGWLNTRLLLRPARCDNTYHVLPRAYSYALRPPPPRSQQHADSALPWSVSRAANGQPFWHAPGAASTWVAAHAGAAPFPQGHVTFTLFDPAAEACVADPNASAPLRLVTAEVRYICNLSEWGAQHFIGAQSWPIYFDRRVWPRRRRRTLGDQAFGGAWAARSCRSEESGGDGNATGDDGGGGSACGAPPEEGAQPDARATDARRLAVTRWLRWRSLKRFKLLT